MISILWDQDIIDCTMSVKYYARNDSEFSNNYKNLYYSPLSPVFSLACLKSTIV